MNPREDIGAYENKICILSSSGALGGRKITTEPDVGSRTSSGQCGEQALVFRSGTGGGHRRIGGLSFLYLSPGHHAPPTPVTATAACALFLHSSPHVRTTANLMRPSPAGRRAVTLFQPRATSTALARPRAAWPAPAQARPQARRNATLAMEKGKDFPAEGLLHARERPPHLSTGAHTRVPSPRVWG